MRKRRPKSRLNKTQVRDIRKRAAAGEKHASIGKGYGMSRASISSIACGNSYKYFPGVISRRRNTRSSNTRVVADGTVTNGGYSLQQMIDAVDAFVARWPNIKKTMVLIQQFAITTK